MKWIIFNGTLFAATSDIFFNLDETDNGWEIVCNHPNYDLNEYFEKYADAGKRLSELKETLNQ